MSPPLNPLDGLRQDLRALDGELKRRQRWLRYHLRLADCHLQSCVALKRARRLLTGIAQQLGLPVQLAGLRRLPRRRPRQGDDERRPS